MIYIILGGISAIMCLILEDMYCRQKTKNYEALRKERLQKLSDILERKNK